MQQGPLTPDQSPKTDTRVTSLVQFLIEPDSNRAIPLGLASICQLTGAVAGVIVRFETGYNSDHSWMHPAQTDDPSPSLDQLLLLARGHASGTSSTGTIASPDGEQYSTRCLLLSQGDERLGVLAVALKQDDAKTTAEDLNISAALLTARLHSDFEGDRTECLLAQYERGFKTLDRQVRVLDLERQKLAAVLNNSEIGFLVVNEDLKVTWANPAMALHLNAAGSGFGVLKQRCHEVVCGQDGECDHCPARKAHTGGEAERTEINASYEGEKRRLYSIAVPIRGSQGEVKEVLLMVQDLTRMDALKRSEMRYRLLFESSLDAIFMAAPPEYRIVMANPATLDLLGYDESAIAAVGLADIHKSDEWPHMKALYKRALTGGHVRSEDSVVLDREGKEHVCNVIALPFDLEGKEVLMCNLRDITARKKTEDDLAGSLSLLQGTLDSTADGILVVSFEGRITSHNQKFVQMWNIPIELMNQGDSDRALEHVLDQLENPAAFLEKIQELHAHPEVESWDIIRFIDGRVFERYSKPHRIGNQGVGRVWSFRDITERKKAEASLQYRLRFENLISTLSTHFINLAVNDLDEGIHHALKSIGTFANADRCYIVLFDEEHGQFTMTHEWCAQDVSSQRERIVNISTDALPWFSNRIRNHEVIHLSRLEDLPAEATAEKEEFHLRGLQSLVAVPMVYGQSFLGFMGFDAVRAQQSWTSDVVLLLQIASDLLSNALARKRADSEKLSLEGQLRQSQKMEAVGTLAGGIAHDFNNLLTGILGYADMLSTGGLSETQIGKAAEVIERAARRAADLTQQLLGFARKGKYQNIPVDLHATVHEVCSLLGRTLDKNITLNMSLGAQDPFVLGDPVQIQQIILNLSVNARDAMTEGGTLSFETERVTLRGGPNNLGRSDELRDCVRLVVSDTGCGIAPEVQSRIFEPFFTTKEQGKGTGMGLSMVYGIVKNHGGSICVSSDEGRGTRFEILLPTAERPMLIVDADQTEVVTRKTGELVLLVDDESLIRGVGSAMLDRLGYRIITAVDGIEAIEIYKNRGSEIALVILDMVMPRMGGKDCFRHLRELDPDARVILSTGFALDDATRALLAEGVAGFAQKPYVLKDLAQFVNDALHPAPA